MGTGVATMAAGGSGVVPLSLGMLSLLGAGAACNNTPVDGNDPYPQVDGCQKVSDGGYGVLQVYGPGQTEWVDFSTSHPYIDVTEITRTFVFLGQQTGKWVAAVEGTRLGGGGWSSADARFDTEAEANQVQWRIRVVSGTCAQTGNDPKPYPPNIHDTIQYTDTTTNCTYNISTQGFAQESEGGGAGVVFKIEAAGPAIRAGGGVVGGCNFEPTLVYQPPGGGPPTTIPWDPSWPDWDGNGQPPWLSALAGALGGAAAAAVSQAMEELLNPPLPVGNRSIYAACDYKEDGSPETFSVNYPQEKYQDRVLTALDALVSFQQQILLWKTPTCNCSPSPVTGEPVTITWQADEPSPASGTRVRKIFTYFDQSGSPQLDHVLHWKDFVWQAGPVIVSVNGVPLGKPQVWAASADEGKRVINHAAAIAGVDMTKAEWLITSPRSPRYGVPGTMRVYVDRKKKLWVTKRDGPSGPVGLYG